MACSGSPARQKTGSQRSPFENIGADALAPDRKPDQLAGKSSIPMPHVKHLDLVQPYLDSVELERRVLQDVLLKEGLDPRRPLVANGVTMSNVGNRRTYRKGQRVLLRLHFDHYLVTAIEIGGAPLTRLAWAG